MNILITRKLYKSKNCMQATVLSIAGSDPTGGAGIQADLKTLTSIGVYGAAVITCVTVQNSHGVVRVECLPADLVHDQIRIVLDDHRVTHVKIGMVGSHEIGRAITAALSGFQGEMIYDPVMVSSTGHTLAERGTAADLPAILADHCTVLTPNVPELELLAKATIKTDTDIRKSIRKMFDRHQNLRAVLVKGGHVIRGNEIRDSLAYMSKDGLRFEIMSHPAIDTANIHGTGCTLASAFAAFHCLTGDYHISFRESVKYMQAVLENSKNAQVTRNKQGQGCMLHSSSPVPHSGNTPES